MDKDRLNELRRKYYESNKIAINKRRREQYAERRALAEYDSIDIQLPHQSPVKLTGDLRKGKQKLHQLCDKVNAFTESYDDVDEDSLPKIKYCINATGGEERPMVVEEVDHALSHNSKNFEKRKDSHEYGDDHGITKKRCSNIMNTPTAVKRLLQTRPAAANSSSFILHEGFISNDNRFLSMILLQNERTLVLPKVPSCIFCGAHKFYRETDRFCCSGGEIVLTESILPNYLVQLLCGTDAKSKDFQSMIRTYNNHFAFTSIGMHCDENYQHRDRGIYTVRVQGQVYHYINDLLPQDVSSKLCGIQFYFYDPEHQIVNRSSALPRMDVSIVTELVALMERNPYSVFLRQASELQDIQQYNIVLRADLGLDQRRFNRSSSNEVAGIWIEGEADENIDFSPWDVKVYMKSGSTRKIKYYYACYDPLQYVLLFPNGESGWNGDMTRIGCLTKKQKNDELYMDDENSFVNATTCANEGTSLDMCCREIGQQSTVVTRARARKRSTVSCREYYVYKFQHRRNDRSYIVRFGRLFKQYIIDSYIKLESIRLAYLEDNQKKIRREYYQGVIDSVVSGIQVGSKVGKRIYLSPTFIGRPRDMRQRYLDSMALVQQFGRPDIFLTMTCNHNWPEIKELLHPGEESQIV